MKITPFCSLQKEERGGKELRAQEKMNLYHAAQPEASSFLPLVYLWVLHRNPLQIGQSDLPKFGLFEWRRASSSSCFLCLSVRSFLEVTPSWPEPYAGLSWSC